MKNGDMPAMPCKHEACSPGLTKREHFAGLAMQSIFKENLNQNGRLEVAIDCVQMADALLKELDT